MHEEGQEEEEEEEEEGQPPSAVKYKIRSDVGA
jgi:hypothetical protein